MSTGWVCGRLTRRDMDVNIAVHMSVCPSLQRPNVSAHLSASLQFPFLSTGQGCLQMCLSSFRVQTNTLSTGWVAATAVPRVRSVSWERIRVIRFLFSIFPDDKQCNIQGQEKLDTIGWRVKSLNNFKNILKLFSRSFSVFQCYFSQ